MSQVAHLTTGDIRSCGCLRRETPAAIGKAYGGFGALNLTGQVFGRLTVVSRVKRPESVKGQDAFWLCRCACNAHTVVIRGSNLRRGKTKSCGCIWRDNAATLVRPQIRLRRVERLKEVMSIPNTVAKFRES